MMYKRLFILVEGDDDVRFFDRIARPLFEKSYDYVKTLPHSRWSKKKLGDLLKSIEAMQGEYIYTEDMNLAPCVTAKKGEIQERIRRIDTNKILVVVRTIEGWYLAGLGDTASRSLGISGFKNTDRITKDKFNDVIPARFASRIDFMIEILKVYSAKQAKRRNRSFMYFWNKYAFSSSTRS